MYGQIHCVIRELIQTKFGEETWEIILRKSNLDKHNSFLMFTRYDDASTFSLVGAVSDTLGVPVETVLEIFGEFFFDYCLRHGYDKMLRTLGSDIKSFIQNLDSLHSLLALSYKGISAPSFRCEDGPDGDLILHYYSCRPGLYPIVKGVLKAVARDLFHQSVEMSIIEQNKEDIGCNQSQEHTAFRVQLRMGSKPPERPSPEGSSDDVQALVEFNPETILLRATDFCSAFPYHIIFDRDLRIRQCGDLVRKHSHIPLREGMPLTQAFSIVHPKMVLSIGNIRKFINAVFLLAISPQENGRKTMLLKGQMIWLSDTQNMIFIGSPRLTSLNELMEMNVYLADIPLYDVTRELVLLNQQRIAEIDIAKRLDETTAELKKTSQALEEEKSKTETLLHQMLPRKVAKALTHGQKVEAEKFDQVTILFSDIVTFTNIASACSPMDIVNMLNDLYQRFDERTSQHNVYKVETIGDAYMIVSGVPEQTSSHAQPVANFAMDMIQDAGLVRSPATGLPLQIRVGVHTGPVVAGVVGVKMPRYCLFGDTVNTASRMESHGLPARIHLSPTVYRALLGWGYAFKHRGQMEVKGKGTMSTYFLCGHLRRRLEEPQDDYTHLHIHQDGTEHGCFVPRSRSSHENIDQAEAEAGLEGQDPEEVPAAHSSDDEGGRMMCPSFYSSSTPENSPEKDHPGRENSRKHINENSDNLSRSESQMKLVRMKKISRTSDGSVRLQQGSSTDREVTTPTSPNKDVVAVPTTTFTLPSPSTSTSLHEPTRDASIDCIYINGSFKNTYRGRNSIDSQCENTSRKQSSTSGDTPTKILTRSTGSVKQNSPIKVLGSSNRAQVLHNTPLTSQSILKKTASQKGHKDPPQSCDSGNPSHLLTAGSSSEKNKPSILSTASSSSSLVSSRSMTKSETFPQQVVPCCPQTKPTSASQGDLQSLASRSKSRRRKKHHSKLCRVA